MKIKSQTLMVNISNNVIFEKASNIMATNTNIPFEATPPGTLIKDELEVRDDITQKDLAMLLGVKPSFLNEIIKGKRPITADIAILLEKTLDIPADYWMKFQSQYEIDLAKTINKLKEKFKIVIS